MKKKIIIISAILLIIISLAIAVWFLFNSPDQHFDNPIIEPEIVYPTAQEAGNWYEGTALKEMPIEYISDEEASEMNLSTSTDIKLQVIQRSDEGEVLEYKKVRSDKSLMRYGY